ncbi:MAG: alpha/beta hydrolase domain-containing protein [Halioglobus sp.]
MASAYTLVKRLRGMRSVLLFLVSLLAGGCSDGSDDPVGPARPQPANPLVQGPVTGGGGDDCCVIDFGPLEVDLREQGYTPGTPFYAGLSIDEANLGYIESEFFISGDAVSYVATDDLGNEGFWTVQAAESEPYVSRIVVVRPAAAADFNGTVVVEWFNVSGGLDAAPDWLQLHTELRREGYAWVGVSAQFAGIEGGGPFGLPLKAVDGERYASLSHPGDSFSYDIFAQAAQAVRRPLGVDPLDGLSVERMIAVGQSQSAGRLTTFYNAVHPLVDVFDAYLIHSRGDGGAPLSQEPQAVQSAPEPTYIRTDLPEAVIGLQTETDIFLLNSVAMRQPDADNYRLWEVAGAAHSDVYTTIKGPVDIGDDPAVADVISNKDARPPFIQCDLPVNDGPGHWVAKAAIHALDVWVRTGEAAPAAPWLTLDDAQQAFALDNLGNVLGGIRTPYVDAPVAVLSGEGQPPASVFCGLFGTTELFSEAMLDMLYPTPETYISAIDTATDAAVSAGFLRPADADLIKRRARTSNVSATGSVLAFPLQGKTLQF